MTDDGRFVFTIEDAGATFVVRGLGVQMRDGDGSLVYIDAGRVVFDALTGEVISATPNPLSQDYAALVCATLGAEPAA